jgi:glycerol 2-dehydrogenase (NADP+)
MATNIQTKSFVLNTGAKIPAIGFGTWKAGPGEAAAAVQAAFEAGYRHFVRWPPRNSVLVEYTDFPILR